MSVFKKEEEKSMNVFKKVISLLLVAVMLSGIVMLTGCGEDSPKGGDVITWLVPCDKQKDVESVLKEANKIIEAELGVTLDMQFIDTASYTQRMNMNMASGNDYDICFTSGWLNSYDTAVQRGGILQLDELLETTPALKESIPDYVWDGVMRDGGMYAVPNMQIMATTRCQYVLKRLADKYELDVENANHPEKLEEFLAKVKAGEPNIYPYRANYGAYPWVTGVYECFSGVAGIRYDDETITPVCFWETDEYKSGIKTLNEWFKKGYIRSDYLSKGDDTADLNAGKYAVWEASYKPGAEAEYASLIGEEVIALPPYEQTTISGESLTSAMLAIGKNSKNPEKAIKVIELLNTNKELYRLIAFGIEGKHYTLSDEGKLSYIENSGYTVKDSWKFGNTFNGYPLEGQESTIFEDTIAFNDSATPSRFLGFTLDTSNLESEISQIATVKDEFSPIGYSGDLDAYYKDFIKKLRDAGSQVMVDEIGKQIKEFVKNNK